MEEDEDRHAAAGRKKTGSLKTGVKKVKKNLNDFMDGKDVIFFKVTLIILHCF